MCTTSISRRGTLWLLAASLCAAVASCTVGPNYQRPKLAVPTTYKSSTTQAATRPAAPLAADWWKLFGDPRLSDLETQAIKANPDLQAAVARVAQARAAARISQSQFYPVINFNPSVSQSRASLNRSSLGTRVSSSGSVTDVAIPFDLTYEIDVWGRVKRNYESAVATAAASALDYQVVLQTLEADVAQDYFNLRSLDSQDEILNKTAASYRKQIDLTQKQLKAGLVSRIDLLQAQTLLDSTIAQEIDIRRQRADQEHAIAILLGRSPAELDLATQPMDLIPPLIPVGLPVELLSRRPDVAEAEQNLVAANAQIGVATAQFYPTISLTGAAGFESLDLRHAIDWQSRFWSIGPSALLPIFEGGRLNANLQQVKARYDELNAEYRSRVLVAFREVEDSLTDLHFRADAARAQADAVQSATEYLRLAQTEYDRGLANATYLLVIDAERTLLSNELSANQILNQRMISTVLLIKALGGGWEPGTQPATPAIDERRNVNQ